MIGEEKVTQETEEMETIERENAMWDGEEDCQSRQGGA